MMSSLRAFFASLGRNKWKIFLGLFSFFAFLFVLFPFADLSDLIGTKVSELTQNQVFLRFGQLGFSVFPHPGVQLGEFSIDSSFFPGKIEASEVTVSPSLSALFTQIPFGTVSAKGFLKGNVEVSLKSGTKSEAGAERQRIDIQASDISLAELSELGSLPVQIKGKLDLESHGQADLTFSEQPDADVTIHAEKFELPSQTLSTMMGPINIPDLRMSSVELKGKLSGGHLTIEEGRIGNDGDEIKGHITGNIALNLLKKNGVQPQLGAYTFDIDLTIKSGLEEKLSLFLAAVSQFKTLSGDSSRYQFRVTAQNPAFPPSMTGLH